MTMRNESGQPRGEKTWLLAQIDKKQAATAVDKGKRHRASYSPPNTSPHSAASNEPDHTRHIFSRAVVTARPEPAEADVTLLFCNFGISAHSRSTATCRESHRSI
jgi:hypothetical protein